MANGLDSVYGGTTVEEQKLAKGEATGLDAAYASQPEPKIDPIKAARQVQTETSTLANKAPSTQNEITREIQSGITGDNPIVTETNQIMNTMTKEDRNQFHSDNFGKTAMDKLRSAKRWMLRAQKLITDNTSDILNDQKYQEKLSAVLDMGGKIKDQIVKESVAAGKGLYHRLIPGDWTTSRSEMVGTLWKARGDKYFDQYQTKQKEAEAMPEGEQKIKALEEAERLRFKAATKRSIGNKLQQERAEYISKSTTPEERAGIAYNFGSGVGTMLEAWGAATAIPVPFTAGAVLSAEGAANIYDKAIDAGLPREKALKVAATNGLVNTALEQVGFDFIFKNPAISMIKRIAQGFLTESAQEGLQQGWDNYTVKKFIDKNQRLSENVLSSAIVGGLVGMVGGSMGSLSMQEQAKARDLIEDTLVDKHIKDFQEQGLNEDQAKNLVSKLMDKSIAYADSANPEMLTDQFKDGIKYLREGKEITQVNGKVVPEVELETKAETTPAVITEAELKTPSAFDEVFGSKEIADTGIPEQMQKKTETDITDVALETAKTYDQWVEKYSESPLSAGLAVREQKISDIVNVPEGSLRSVNPEADKRWEESRGIKPPGILSNVKEKAANLYKSFTQKYTNLDRDTDAKLYEELREFEALPEYSELMSKNVIQGILSGMGKNQYDVFNRNVVLEDLNYDIDRGLITDDKLPFGYKNAEEVKTDLAKFKSTAQATPEIARSLEARTQFMKGLRQALVDYNIMPESVLDNDAYFHHQVLEYMAAKDAVTRGKDVRAKKYGWEKARTGSAKDFNTDYIQAEYEVISQAIAKIETIKTLNRIKSDQDITQELKNKHGENWKENIPEGYTLWQPEKGNVFYLANSLTDKAIANLIEGNKEFNADKDVRQVLALGSKRLEWVIPDRVAKTLDNVRDFKKDDYLGSFFRGLNSSWKQWVLLNPYRVVKYNLNNTAGDTAIVWAYNPKILNPVELYKSARDLWKVNVKKMSANAEMLEAVKKGVIGSGMTEAEIQNINKEGIFKALTGKADNNLINKYWGNVKNFTNWRENILRLTSYRWFKKQLDSGKKVYGVSRKAAIDKLATNSDKAAKMARELVGDYGNVSVAGQWLREHAIPFYSWVEVNSPRYLMLMRNLIHEGGTPKTRVGKVAKFTAKAPSKVAFGMAAMYILRAIWNATFFPDEQEKLGKSVDKLGLIILGKDDSGRPITIRLEDGFSDMLEWIGLDDFPQDFKDMAEGRKTMLDIGKEIPEAASSRLINSLSPALKTGYELAAGKSFYPSVTKPRPIRDRGEHIASALSVKDIYNLMAGKPVKGGLKGALPFKATQTTDPGENAYWEIRQMINDFKEKRGQSPLSLTPTPKSNALYYYKKSLMYGEEEKANKYLEQYFKLGGTREGIRRSETAMSLTNAIGKDRKEFMNSLSPEELQRFEVGEEWIDNLRSLSKATKKEFYRTQKRR